MAAGRVERKKSELRPAREVELRQARRAKARSLVRSKKFWVAVAAK